MSFLELKGLSKRYDGVLAVADCNLTIAEGEFVCLLGPSGCGKTTTLQMIAGFVEPTSGSILLDGADITHVKPSQRGLGIVFQSYALFPHMTVGENVAFGLEMRKVDAAERRRRVADALELVHLGPMAARYPRELSGGQRQRVALARALVIQPPVLLLDEPMGALDAKLREEMQIELRALQHRVGITTIMVTHDQAEAMTLADRVVLMNKGRVEQVGRPFEMYEHPNGRFSSTFLGKANVFEAVRDSARGPVQVQGYELPCDDAQAQRRARIHRAAGEGGVRRRGRRPGAGAASARACSWATTGCSRSTRPWARCSSRTPTPACRKPRRATKWACAGRPNMRAWCRAPEPRS